MKKFLTVIILLFVTLSCSKMFFDETEDTAENNFEALWRKIDEGYSFFDLKGIDWNKIKLKYRSKITNGMSPVDLFDVLDDMLQELKDGHVNIYAPFNVGRNWDWYLDYPQNFDPTIIERVYLGKNHIIISGIRYSVLNYNGKEILYIRYSSFSSSPNGIKELFTQVKKSARIKGAIIDVRNNGGGALDYAKNIANVLSDKKRLVNKFYYKIGKEHDNFSKAYDFYIEPSIGGVGKPVVILTNRKCYSATSFFASMVKSIPYVTVMGDTTGGGSGIPTEYQLPNGWIYRYSSTRTSYYEPADNKFYDFELGVPPTVVLPPIPRNLNKDIDTWINTSLKFISDKSNK